MKKKKNRRTLKKRIKRALNFTAFITVFFLSGIMFLLLLGVSKIFIIYQAETVAHTIHENIDSGNAAKALGITSIDKMNLNDIKTKEWLDSMDKTTMLNDIFPGFNHERYIIIEIEMNDKIVYTNAEDYNQVLPDFYKDTEVKRDIYDKDHNTIGSIRVEVNADIVVAILIFVVVVITAISIAALFIAKAFTMILIIPISNPIYQLEKKVKAMAEGDNETASNTQLIMKKPLREIESLIDSTNQIMRKLHGYNEILENQKDILENQNSELEMQNEELLQSKQHIQEQQAQLIQSEKMASVGMLTAAITHEINTPIGAINSNAQLEEMLLFQLTNHSLIQTNEELNTLTTQMKEVNDVNLIACSRIIEIIKSLKSYSRIDQAEYQEANINEGIKSVLVLTNNLLKRRIIVHEYYEDIPPIRCFPGQLNQVIMNIIVNASQAIEGEGEIFIHTYQREQDVYISIRDSGSGIKPEDITKLFDPGFTTKGVGIGLGLGLYISYNIVQKHGGDIIVNSEPGRGSEFIIRIPMDINLTNE